MKQLSHPQRIIGRILIINLFLLIASLVWFATAPEFSGVEIAAAKGKQMMAMNLMAEIPFSTETLQAATLNDPLMSTISAGKELQFVNAFPLSTGEARPWSETGCAGQTCAHVIHYNITDGGTINSIVNYATNEVISIWTDPAARPGGSLYIVDKAFDIAAEDEAVTAVLGNLGAAEPAMVPMSGWLYDDDCQEEWCVDLSFHDPAGSGRIYHVFVNMEQNNVARTFFTRGRSDRSQAAALPQGQPYRDGCHAQYGWELCWEMTAHDGLNFRDATFQETLIFSSIKIGQIEAWYPSWPGGYRDEIGFSASVPPFGGTQINDLGDSFEVRQLFTEFTHWPNCICCYRYEEIIRFYADGSFEPRFVSHGPGCDDLSIYRPFWRIDLDLNGQDGDSVWVWQDTQWVTTTHELEIFPLVDDLSPDGHKIATIDGETSYRWHMQRTDPLGLDEGRLFILQQNENEGDGPIITGPGDTFQPPRQWVDGEPATDTNIVIWYVPLLKTKKGGPWWCMPDPEPDFTPCEAVLRVEKAGELHQPTAEEMAEAEIVLSPTPLASAAITPAPTTTPRPIDGETPDEIILNAGCGACHLIGTLGEAHKVGPDLSTIGLAAADRIEGMTAEDYLRQSILEPNAFLVPDCPNSPCIANIMPRDYANRLSPEQVEVIVEYLLNLTEEPSQPTIIGEDTGPSQGTPAPKAFPAPKINNQRSQKNLAGLAIQVLLVTLVFLLILFRLIKQPVENS